MWVHRRLPPMHYMDKPTPTQHEGVAIGRETGVALESDLTIQIFVYPQAWAEHLLWASILLFILSRGPGAWSLDHLVEQHFVKRERFST